MTLRQAAAAMGYASDCVARAWALDHNVTWAVDPARSAPRVADADLPPLLADQPLLARDCKALWVAVLAEQWRAAFYPYEGVDGPRLRRDAAAWFGTRDFHMVCALAGFDGPAVHERFRVQWARVI